MKVRVILEYDVEPEKELNNREHSNAVGMLQRVTRNRVMPLVSQRLGGEHAAVGWEILVNSVVVSVETKA